MTSSVDTHIALSIKDLTVTLPDGRRLLNRANLDVAHGEFLLLVGASGSGKSTLLTLIGRFGERRDGECRVTGSIRVLPPPSDKGERPRVGMVFQTLALFDELSPVDNVCFAIDHRGAGPDGKDRAAQREAPRAEAKRRLGELGVPDRSRISDLSGGERQRVALARTMAVEPAVLLFDEPTTGLDPYRSRNVAEMIARTHRESGKTVLVVTHDFAPFLPHRPRLVLLDAEEGTLREIDEAALREYFGRSQPATPSSVEQKANGGGRGAGIERMLGLLEEPGRVVVAVGDAVVAPFCGWRRPRWKLRYLWHYLRMVLFGTTAVYVAIAGAMLGFVTVLFGFSQMPYAEVTVPLLTEEFLAAAGYSTYRVLGPVLVSLLIAGKCGAAVAADVGARRLTHQFEAMRSFAARPRFYLYGNIVVALVVGCPVLTLIAYLANSYAALVAFLMTSDEATIAMFRNNFFATIMPSYVTFPIGTGWMIAKMTSSGVVIAALAYSIGSRAKHSAVDVSRDVGLAIFWGSLAVLALHAAFSFVEF